jgi:hypothetical protein
MKVGFTGNRDGMTEEQVITVKHLLSIRPVELHHGDCVGCDADAHAIAIDLGIPVVGHPPDLPGLRMFLHYAEEREEKPYLERNHDIVNETDILIACPKQAEEVMRSGTWATVRYARKVGKAILIVYPSGKMFFEKATWTKIHE